jgi:omega-amidase
MKWKIAFIQMDIAFRQPDINFQVAEQWMEKAARSEPDIVYRSFGQQDTT